MMKLSQPSVKQLQNYWNVSPGVELKAVTNRPASIHLSIPAMRSLLTLPSNSPIKATASQQNNQPTALIELRNKLALVVNMVTKKYMTVPLHEVKAHNVIANAMKQSNPALQATETHLNLENGVPVLRTVLPLAESTHAYEIKTRVPQAPLNPYIPRRFELHYGIHEGNVLTPISHDTSSIKTTNQMLKAIQAELRRTHPNAAEQALFQKARTN